MTDQHFGGKWTVRRTSRGDWQVVSPWTIRDGFIRCNVRGFATWRDALDHATSGGSQ